MKPTSWQNYWKINAIQIRFLVLIIQLFFSTDDEDTNKKTENFNSQNSFLLFEYLTWSVSVNNITDPNNQNFPYDFCLCYKV
jgi:4-alpha-glucanotransferase